MNTNYVGFFFFQTTLKSPVIPVMLILHASASIWLLEGFFNIMMAGSPSEHYGLFKG